MAKFFSEEVDAGRGARDVAKLPVIEKRTRARFRAMVNQDAWMWSPRLGCYVPSLGRMVISGGVMGTAILQGGREDDSACRANWSKKGWQVIELGDQRFPNGGKYIKRWKTYGNGWAYTYAWETPNSVAGEIIWHDDQDAHDAFLKAIVD